MATITVYGASDDLVEVEGPLKGCDEYASDDETFVFSGATGAVRLRCNYSRGGVWEITAGPLNEDTQMLPVQVTQGPNRYTAAAIISGVDMVIREAVDRAG